MANMKRGDKAQLLLRERLQVTEQLFVELVIWRVPHPVKGSSHDFKYRLAVVADGVCVVRYDNEAGKGDHKHLLNSQIDYSFSTLEQLQTDFWREVSEWSGKR